MDDLTVGRHDRQLQPRLARQLEAAWRRGRCIRQIAEMFNLDEVAVYEAIATVLGSKAGARWALDRLTTRGAR